MHEPENCKGEKGKREGEMGSGELFETASSSESSFATADFNYPAGPLLNGVMLRNILFQ